MGKIKIVRISNINDHEIINSYTTLVRKGLNNLFYVDVKYHKLLQRILDNVEIIYLFAYLDAELVGALPLFLKKETKFGNVVNSLPFFGSNGGIIVAPELGDAMGVKKALIDDFYKLSIELNALSSTIIESPLEPDQGVIRNLDSITHIDYRIGQFTPLPYVECEAERAHALINNFHYKTRNMIRKGIKSNFNIYHSGTIKDFKQLHKIHCENMQAIGAIPKPWNLYQGINDIYEYNKDYRIYIAEKNGQIAASLLLFYFNQIVEYYTPVISHEFRSEQPLSNLIFQAMLDAMNEGYTWWNWGGTWPTQDSVYRFKSRWGTIDKKYHYFTVFNNDKIKSITKETILKEYSYFYVLPFEAIKTPHKKD